MGKFSSTQAVKAQPKLAKGPVKTTGASGTTFEGGAAFSYGVKSELFLLAVTNMVGEDTFYESAQDRDDRFVRLVHEATKKDPEWVAAFIPYLRSKMFMRSATIVAAAEYIKAGGPNGRAVVASALQRPDEPGEIIGYWQSKYGRNLPMPLKRGIADAVTGKYPKRALYTENAAVKYDGDKGIRLGDVIELTHPGPIGEAQSTLFAYLLDRRHHAGAIRADMTKLPRITAIQAIDKMTDAEFTKALKANPTLLADTGYTWERLSSARPALNVWDAVIPAMGYMATMRNLRNFEQKGISAASKKIVIDRLTDPEQVAKSMQFPFRFLTAQKFTETHTYSGAIETALDLSVQNIPEVAGRTLVLVDVSGSMSAALSAKSRVARWEVGALFGVAQALRAQNSDLVIFGQDSAAVRLPRGASVLRGIEAVHQAILTERVGHATEMWRALDNHYDGHDRVFIFTDEQTRGTAGVQAQKVPTIYSFNLAGYGRSALDLSGKGRHTFGGFSDAVFRLVPMIERGKDAPWPWELATP